MAAGLPVERPPVEEMEAVEVSVDGSEGSDGEEEPIPEPVVDVVIPEPGAVFTPEAEPVAELLEVIGPGEELVVEVRIVE